MRHTRRAVGKDGIRKDSFSLYKPNGNGPLEAGGRGNGGYPLPATVDERIVDKLRRLGWNSEFSQKVLKLKKALFKDDKCFSEEVDGQVFSANFEKRVDGVKVSLYILRERAYMNMTAISKKKRIPKIDEFCKAFGRHMPGMEFVKQRKKIEHTDEYLVTVEGNLYHPDTADRYKNNNKKEPGVETASGQGYIVGPAEGC